VQSTARRQTAQTRDPTAAVNPRQQCAARPRRGLEPASLCDFCRSTAQSARLCWNHAAGPTRREQQPHDGTSTRWERHQNMTLGGQLNIHSYRNQNSREVQTVRLFHHQELRAELLVLPPGTTVEWHTPERHAELLDVVEGEGRIAIGAGEWGAPMGKCVLVMAGARNKL